MIYATYCDSFRVLVFTGCAQGGLSNFTLRQQQQRNSHAWNVDSLGEL